MQLVNLSAAMVLCLGGVFGCAEAGGGDDDDDSSVDASSAPDGSDIDSSGLPIDAAPLPIDAAQGTGAFGLGRLCTAPSQCPATYQCVVITDVGSQTAGFCTLSCTTAVDCMTGYTGPGTPACNLDDGMGGMSCSVSCTLPTDCPTGLTCIMNLCVQP